MEGGKLRKYQICERCVMDTTDPLITFDENGFCNHCTSYFEKEGKFVFKGEEGQRKLQKLIDKIKAAGTFSEYDCLLGVSGGTDSSYVAYLAKQYGLHVLLFSFDNGWDTVMAKKNVTRIVDATGFDVFKYIVDFDEFRDLQLAFSKASVINIEMITDHAIAAALYKVAIAKHIKYILTGINYVTEAIMPASWGHRFNDLPNIKAIHQKYGTKPLKTYPTMSLWKLVYNRVVRGIQLIPILNYVDYNKEEAKKKLRTAFRWRDYGLKHYESLWTKFYQSYILPRKFGVDKRKAHLSTLICSGQITRQQALKELKKPAYDPKELEHDMPVVLKKLGVSDEEFEDLMKLPIKKHQEYGTDEWFYLLLRGLKDLYTAFK